MSRSSSPPPYSEINQSYQFSKDVIEKLKEHFENLSLCEDEEERKLQLTFLADDLTNQGDKDIVSFLQESFSFDLFDLGQYKLEIRKYLPRHEEGLDACQVPMFSPQFIENLPAHFEKMTKFKDERNRSFQFTALLKKANEEDKVILEQIQQKVTFGSFDIEQYKLEFKPYLPQQQKDENEEEEEEEEPSLTTDIEKENKQKYKNENEKGNEDKNENGNGNGNGNEEKIFEKVTQIENEINEDQIQEALMKNEKMPECSEKRINQLILFIEAMNNKIEKLRDKEISQKLIDIELKLLFEQIGKEEPTVVEKLNRNIQELKRSRQVFDWKKMKRELLEILKHWKVIDIGEILELIEKTNEASKSIEDQDILLLLGETGVGKSTTIHYLTGSIFEKITKNGITYYTPIKYSPTLEKVITSCQAKSETRYVTAIPVSLRKVGVNKNGDIIICDTPGFDDTSGPEVDVANGIGLIRAISKSKSVRPVILISALSVGDRLQGLRSLTHILIGMLPSIGDHLESVSYVFVKYTSEQRKNIHGNLKDLQKNLNEEERRDEAFCQLIEDMIQKTESDILYITLEGNEDKRKYLFRTLVKNEAISNPGDYFTSFVTEKSRGLIQQQANFHQNQIIKASKRNDYKLVEYKLNELKSLCHTLETDEGVKGCYQESIQSLKEIIKSIYNNATINLGKCFDQENKLTQQDLQDYLDSYNILRSSSSVRDKHLGHEAISLDALLLFLNSHVKQLITRTLQLDFQSESQILLKNLDKLKLISGFDSKFNAQNSLEYKKIQEHFKGEFEKDIQKNKSLLKEDRISESSKIMDQIKDTSLHFTSHFDEVWLTSQYQQLIQDFNKYFENIISIDVILEKKNVNQKDIGMLISKMEKLEAIRNDISLRSHIPIENIQEAYNKFIESILELFNSFVNEINNSMEQSDGDLKSIKSSIDQMSLLRQIPHIDGKTAETYYQSITFITSTVDKLNIEMEGILESLMSGDYIEAKKLVRIIDRFINFAWLQELEESNYTEKLNQFQEFLGSYIIKLEDKSEQIRKNSDIEAMKKILSQLPNVSSLENLIPIYSEKRKNIINRFEGMIETNLKDFELLLQDQNSETDTPQLDFWKFQKTLSFLENFQDSSENPLQGFINGDILEKASIIFRELRNFVQQYISTLREDVERILGTIVDDMEPEMKPVRTKIRRMVQVVREVKEKSNPNFLVMKLIERNDLNYLNNWPETLIRLYNDMDDSIRILKDDDPSKLDVKLQIVKILSETDPIFQANGDSRSFSKLYQENQKLKVIEHKDVKEIAIQAIVDGKFQQAASELRTLKNNGVASGTYNKILDYLGAIVTTTCDDALRQCGLLRNFDEKEIQSVILASSKIKSIETYLLMELKEEQKKQMKETKEKVQNLVVTKLGKIVKGIEDSIRAYNFLEAQRKKDDVTLILQTLGTYLDGLEKVNEQINELEEFKKKVISEIKGKYEEKNIETYYLDPPKYIYEKLLKVEDKSEEYRNLVSELKSILDKKIREAYSDAKTTSPFSEALKKFKSVESAIKTLPEDLQHQLQSELADAKEDAKAHQQGFLEDIKLAIKTYDAMTIISCLESPEGAHSKNETQRQIQEAIQELNQKIKDHLSKNEITEAFPQIQTMIDFSIPFGEKMPMIKQIALPIVKDQLTLVLNQIHDSLINIGHLGSTLEDLDKNFDHFKKFMTFKKDYEKKSEYLASEISPLKTRDMINQIHLSLKNYINNTYSSYYQVVEILDNNSDLAINTQNLQKAFDNVEKMDPLLQKFQSYSQNPIDPAYELNIKHKVLGYDQVLREFSFKIKKIQKEVVEIDILSTHQIIEKERKQFYEKLRNQLNILQCVSELRLNVQGIDITSIYKQCITALDSKFQELSKELDPILQKSYLKRPDFVIIHSRYTNLAICSDTIPNLQSTLKPIVQHVQKQITARIVKFAENVRTSNELELISTSLIQMKEVGENLPTFQVHSNSEIDDCLSVLKKKGNVMIAKVAVYLEKNSVGQTIIAEHSTFKGHSVFLFNSKATLDIHYVLSNLDGDNLNIEKLRDSYRKFDFKYQEILKGLLINKDGNANSLIAEIKSEQKKAQKKDSIQYSIGNRDRIPELIAKIFALWTFQNSSHYFESEGVSNERDKYLLKPHPAQVISIFRILCIGYKEKEAGFYDSFATHFSPKIPLFNNLVQIGTGEGKSVTLAVTSIVLALFGFDVSCACYSQYLSQRDLADFEPLFTLLGVNKHIHYGTFNQIFDIIINEKGDIRSRVQNLISSSVKTNFISPVIANTDRAKILLIDEVDIFFNKEFYGNVYNPAASLKGPEITNLIHYIWNNRNSLNFNSLKTSAEYRACCTRYTQWIGLVEEASKSMILDVKNFNHSYIVLEDKIGYKKQDSISFNTYVGYKTMFAYFKECENEKITTHSRDENVFMKINCGSFSFAELPSKFSYIMGVTGTLKTLSDPEQQVIRENYHIMKKTYSPSVFGVNNRQFKNESDIKIETLADYYNSISREVTDRLIGKTQGTKRAVLVFFESKEKLMKFYNSPSATTLKDNIQIMTEELTSAEKNTFIKKATSSGQITLLSRVFGRGTDFVCRDQVVGVNGGVHVIQVFLSKELSEETQIQGRTARQGDDGSYSMILLDQSLEKFTNLDELKEAQQKTGVYEFLNQKRNDYFRKQYEENEKRVEKAKAAHEATEQFVTAIDENNIEFLQKYLLDHNKST